MENNIVIYTKPEILLHKMGMGYNPDDEEDEAFGTNCEFYWRLNNRPDNIEKVYFATRGYIIGYFEVIECDEGDSYLSWEAKSWTLLEEPIQTSHFRGFKYANKVPELIKQGEEAAK
ncbi:MAG: hypothetical protein HY376_03180 [Candidatus Blackburnbacteria bacterium]|nr:hypothetical protein [Candidatus Blackburnbacteria bacterium]